MKTAAAENSIESTLPGGLRARFMSDFAELVKARLTLLVLLTTAVGFYLGADAPADYVALFHVVFGTAAAAAGAAALNQWWEWKLDGLIQRAADGECFHRWHAARGHRPRAACHRWKHSPSAARCRSLV